jgi:uncharacterized protein DUF3752
MAPQTTAGPALPPHLLAKRKRQQEAAEAAQTSSAQKQPAYEEPLQAPDSPKRRRILGPAAPPAPLDELPSTGAEEEESSDDDYGPSVPTASEHTAALQSVPKAGDSSDDDVGPQAPAEPTVTKRDEWMTLPPTADSLSRLDPARQKARGFNTSRNTQSSGGAGGPSASWTETPEEKRKRLADEVLGISPATGPSSSKGAKVTKTAESRAKDEDTARRIKEHSERYRGESLLTQHQKQKGLEEKEDDPSKRGWDWEKDMKAAPSVGRAKKKEMVDRAGGFSSRFSGGGFL